MASKNGGHPEFVIQFAQHIVESGTGDIESNKKAVLSQGN